MNTPFSTSDKILAIDIGGSHIKTLLLGGDGTVLEERKRLPTPSPASPQAVMEVIKNLAAQSGPFTKAAAGFPGFVKNGVVMTAPNLGTEAWKGTDLQEQLTSLLRVPVIAVNDADFQGAGLVQGNGLEMVLTLGTGFGTALLLNGKLLPHLEVSQHPVTKTKNYDEYIGEAALKEVGEARWNARMQRVLSIVKTVFNYDALYISGGNADLLNFDLGENVHIKSNKDGFLGAVNLWKYESDEIKSVQ